jgi:hypothetical protein
VSLNNAIYRLNFSLNRGNAFSIGGGGGGAQSGTIGSMEMIGVALQ